MVSFPVRDEEHKGGYIIGSGTRESSVEMKR